MKEKTIESLGLSWRASACLKAIGITKIEELTKYSEDDLNKIPSCGHVTKMEIISAMKRAGFPLAAPTKMVQIPLATAELILELLLKQTTPGVETDPERRDLIVKLIAATTPVNTEPPALKPIKDPLARSSDKAAFKIQERVWKTEHRRLEVMRLALMGETFVKIGWQFRVGASRASGIFNEADKMIRGHYADTHPDIWYKDRDLSAMKHNRTYWMNLIDNYQTYLDTKKNGQLAQE